MAHPKLTNGFSGRAMTAGLTSAALVGLMAAGSAAAPLELSGGPDEVVAEAEATVAEAAAPVAEAAEPVVEAAEPVVEAAEPVVEVAHAVLQAAEPVADPVTDVVNDLVRQAPEPGGVLPPPPADPAPTDGTKAADGGSPAPLPEEEATTTGASGPSFGHLLTDTRGATTFTAPVVTTPFSFNVPQMGPDGRVTVPSAAVVDDATVTPVAGLPDLPMPLVATATGLLLLVGAGHLMHAVSQRRVV